MLPGRTFYIVGLSFLFVSVFILIYTFGGVTGNVISEQTGLSMNYYVSIWFFIAGLFVLVFPKLTEKK